MVEGGYNAMRNPPVLLVNQHNEYAAGTWALGQGRALVSDTLMPRGAYRLGGEKTCGDEAASRGGFLEPHGYGYLLAYWYSRAHGLIPGP
jgi:hypothetical protein